MLIPSKLLDAIFPLHSSPPKDRKKEMKKREEASLQLLFDLWPNVLINLISLVGTLGGLLCGLNAAICRWRRVICTRQSSAISMGSLPSLSIRTRTHCVTERFEQSACCEARLCWIKRPFVNAIRLHCSVGNETSVNFLRNVILETLVSDFSRI